MRALAKSITGWVCLGIVWCGLPAITLAAPPEEPAGTGHSPVALAAAIDREVDRRLAEAKVPASPPADDAEFLRRAYLDLTGRIPTVDRAAAFLDNRDPDKRSRLVEALLASPDYGQHFAIIWRDLIVPKDNPTPTRLFTGWLADNFNQNRPWDRMVTDMLAAEGRFTNGRRGEGTVEPAPLTFTLANGDPQPAPAKLAEATARLFLGVRLECAQCHNHPYADWKQDEFWGLAAFFGRTRQQKQPADDKNNKTVTFAVSETATGPEKPGTILIPKTAFKNSGKAVAARFLRAGEPPLVEAKPLRPVLAAWLTAPDNPFFARAAVNRLWSHFFGRGLVNPVDDLRADNPPSHPELLRLLADEFRTSGHDLKHLIRAVCGSRAYQRSSRPLPANREDQQLFSHMAVKVMSPEMLYDSLSLALGVNVLNLDRPARMAKGRVTVDLSPREVFVRFFDTQGEEANAADYSHGMPQALALMNAQQFNTQSPAIGPLVQAAGESREKVIEGLYLTALARRPTPAEIRLMTAYLDEQKNGDVEKGHHGVLWILLNSSEFFLNR